VGIKEVIETINRMQADGVIERYAIGGAVGATFYLEPVATLDVDVFIEFHTEPGSRLVSLEPVLKYLRDHGCIMEGQHIVIAGWPVQFLPAGTPLLQEALEKAIERDLDGTPARVFTAEHIAAIALETGRAKDKARMLQFIEADAIDLDRLQEILGRHGLAGVWKQFEQQFLKQK
jgi:DNA-binding Lrp family transcriptional regulator